MKKLDKRWAKKIISKFEEVAEEPFRFLEHYEGQGHKLRIGDYRALIDVDQNHKILFVRLIDKRERVYKR